MKEESDEKRPAYSHFSDRRRVGIKRRVAHLRLAVKLCLSSDWDSILPLKFAFILIRIVIGY